MRIHVRAVLPTMAVGIDEVAPARIYVAREVAGRRRQTKRLALPARHARRRRRKILCGQGHLCVIQRLPDLQRLLAGDRPPLRNRDLEEEGSVVRDVIVLARRSVSAGWRQQPAKEDTADRNRTRAEHNYSVNQPHPLCNSGASLLVRRGFRNDSVRRGSPTVKEMRSHRRPFARHRDQRAN